MTGIDLTSPDTFFASVLGLLQQRFNVFVMEVEGRRVITGIFGDVSLELDADFVSGIPIVRAKCAIAAKVPLTAALVEDLNGRNQLTPLVAVGIRDEDATPGTVRVRVSASVFGEWITPASVIGTVESCVWPANIVLQQGILASHGGELALIGLYRQLADAGELIGREDDGFRAKVLELEARAARGDVGRT